MAFFVCDIDIEIDSWSSWITEQYENYIGQLSGYCANDIEYTDLLYHLEALYRNIIRYSIPSHNQPVPRNLPSKRNVSSLLDH